MQLQIGRHYFVYILTDGEKTTLRVGTTNDLEQQLAMQADSNNCRYLVYWETCRDPYEAVKRETGILRLSGRRKRSLITKFNPGWHFLNDRFVRDEKQSRH